MMLYHTVLKKKALCVVYCALRKKCVLCEVLFRVVCMCECCVLCIVRFLYMLLCVFYDYVHAKPPVALVRNQNIYNIHNTTLLH